MTPAFFITGTDTGVGKTLVTAALLRAYAALGLRVLGMKPVAAGAESRDGVWINEDAALLRAASNVDAAAEWMNPYLFREAIAPHIAAERKGVEIEIPRIRAALEALQAQADLVLVEGVGGFRVPLSATRDTADLAQALGLPIILVAGMRLGCLNHALLTVEAIAARGLTLAGWVANRIDPDMAAYDENLAALARRIDAPLLAELPSMPNPDPARASGIFAPKRLLKLLPTPPLPHCKNQTRL
ncbi:MAG: dethiobiotin synthase [Betaproteobacteria bacterium]|nr:dethiobiotin synthase [Betaproteobacteria bacterium]